MATNPLISYKRAKSIIDFLLCRRVKAIVIARNTATAVAVETLRARYGLPIVAIEPAVKPAVALTNRATGKT